MTSRAALALVLAWPLAASCGPLGAQRAATLADFRRETVTGSPPGLPVFDDEDWHLSLFHVHSAEGPYEYRSRDALDTSANASATRTRFALRTAATRGIRALFLTDHNSLDAALDRSVRDYATSLGMTLVIGSEYSLGGPLGVNLPVTLGQAGPHLCLVGYSATTPRDVMVAADTRVRPSAEAWAELVEDVHRRGGAVVLAHPDAINADWKPDRPPPVDLVEVDGPFVHNPRAARLRWHEWLMAGERIGAISGADWHVGVYPGRPFQNLNLVRAPSRIAAALTDALRGGHVMVVTGAHKRPRVLMGADADADGSWDDVREGDVLIPAAGATRVRFQVRVIGGRGMALVLYAAVSREPVFRETLDDPDVVRAYSMALRKEAHSFVRAELWDDNRLVVLTNPLYFDAPSALAGDAPAFDGTPLLRGETP